MKKYLLLAALVLCGMLSSCAKSKNGFKVAATPVPHAQMLEFVKSDLKSQGIDLVIIVTDDYNVPNRALANKEVAANFFQHIPFSKSRSNNSTMRSKAWRKSRSSRWGSIRRRSPLSPISPITQL